MAQQGTAVAQPAPATWEAFLPSLRECADDGGIYRFFARIQSAAFTSSAFSSVLEVGTSLMGDTARGTRIYVREAYQQLHAVMSQPSSGPRWVVTGTPGTGKSLFAFLLIRHYAHQQRPVVYEYSSTGDEAVRRAVVLYMGKVYELETRQQTIRALSLPVVYICDALAPWDASHGQAFTILVTSPKQSRYKEWIKQHSIIPRYMPLWSMEDLQQCASVCDLGLSPEIIQQQYERWGGVARAVLQESAESDQQNQVQLQQAVQDADADTAFKAITMLNVIECDRVIHMDVPRDDEGRWLLTMYTEVFASPTIAQRMRSKLFQHNAIEALRIVEQAQTSPQLRGLAGYMFEPLVLRRFVVGGPFIFRPLDDFHVASDRHVKAARTDICSESAGGFAAVGTASKEWQLTVPALDEVLYDSGRLAEALAGLTHGKARALVPTAPNEPLLDFAVAVPGQPLLAVQVTASTDHGVSMAALVAYAQCLPDGAAIHLVFAVPSGIARDFGWQTLRTKSNKVWKAAYLDSQQASVVARLQQWVVAIPVLPTPAETDALQVKFAGSV